MTGLTAMEIEAMRNGAFVLDKDAGIRACRKYREVLEKQGYRTWLEAACFAGFYRVKKELKSH